MSKTPKINRVWNKQEKRIVRPLYRKGFDIDLSNLYWASYKKTGKKYRRKGSIVLAVLIAVVGDTIDMFNNKKKRGNE